MDCRYHGPHLHRSQFDGYHRLLTQCGRKTLILFAQDFHLRMPSIAHVQ
jgi:hypothetical protein